MIHLLSYVLFLLLRPLKGSFHAGLCSQKCYPAVELVELMDRAGWDDHWSAERLTSNAAFCNTVYRVTSITNNNYHEDAIAKIFSKLAKLRMTASFPGEIDQLAAEKGLAPAILATSSSGILMQVCEGRVLTQDEVHGDSDCSANVAQALASLHSLKLPNTQQDNMLWYTCDVMLEQVIDPQYNNQGWSRAALAKRVDYHRSQLDQLHLPVVLGHGDFKPANVFVSNNKTIQFIDLELAGCHYRAFDLAKFFRTNTPTEFTRRNKNAFFKAYAASVDDEVNVQTLEQEAELLTPMTWLEAAIFFACMACQDPQQAEQWNTLALARLNDYELSL
jgi:thiamine kinase-like enzyme